MNTAARTSPMDLNKTCRACLKTATNPILHSLLDDPLKSMFYECTFVKVKPAEQLPFNLCSLCVALCDAAYNFREMCEQNDRKIRMPDMQFIVLPPTPVPVVQQKTLEAFVEKHEPVFADRFIKIDDAPEKEAISAAYSDADPFEEIVESGELVEEDGGVEEEEEDPAAQEQQPEQQEEVFEGEEMEYTMDDNDEDEERDDEGAVEEVDDQQIMSEIILDEDNDNNYTEEEVYEHEKHLETEEHETNQYTTAVDPTESQQCQFCLLDFAEKADLMAHYADDHQYEMYSCPSCNEVLATMNEWRSHVCRLSSVSAARAKKKIRTFHCEYCPLISTQRRQFASHLMTMHPGLTYRCDQCNKQFTNGETWRTHMCKGDTMELGCVYCSAVFGHQAQLTRHIKRHLNPPRESQAKYKNQKVPCDQCDATFHSAFYLKQHQLTHTGETPHACKVCGRPFRSKCNLLRHLRTVHKEPVAKFSEL